ncbi:PREDICTED: probable aquaporin NIP5-1 [Camelina sativa]|uniref:Probable aquaporin NIP5-1 n=1 Tax=Camelina sativa TaxID=90675 RepID=A0ABM0U7K3_CAMSA|nr:PREDICTED: probable aquaporin NIP5-1 [Camelina sativa]
MAPPEAEVGSVVVMAPPTPGTPGTPGGPLITGMRVDSMSFDHRKPMPRCKCLPVMGSTWGQHDTCFTDFPSPDVSLTRKLGAEFVGTFILIFTATAGPIVNQKYDGAETLIGNAACAGLAVMIIILSTGHISGAHLNPSLTIAFAALRHFPWAHVPAYIAAQVSASICASFALKGVFHPFMSGGVTVPSVSLGQAFALEFIITFILLFVVTAVATDTRAVGELAGIAVGATVMLNILVSGPSTGASMNPVRTLGPAVASGNYRSLWIYLVAPTLGAIAGAAVYTGVKLNDSETDPPRQVRSFRR